MTSYKQTKCEETLKQKNSKYDSKTLELSYSQDLNVKETISVFISNEISDHEMSVEIKHIIKHSFRLELGKP